MNQTAARAINKERHYDNESVELVRSLSSCMLSHDSGQGFAAAELIEGSIKGMKCGISLPDLSQPDTLDKENTPCMKLHRFIYCILQDTTEQNKQSCNAMARLQPVMVVV